MIISVWKPKIAKVNKKNIVLHYEKKSFKTQKMLNNFRIINFINKLFIIKNKL